MIDLNVKYVYTLLEEDSFYLYKDNANVEKVFNHLTGYVDDDLIALAGQMEKPQSDREIDIGYRARPLPFFNGKGAQEKTEIGTKFVDFTKDKNLALNIKTGEEDRIYGNKWHAFIANCKAMLGVEAGVSIFDIDGKAEKVSKNYLLDNPNATFDEVHRAVLQPFEDKVFYRMISPRIFECAAFKTCMILYEGKYNGIIKPDVHYIPLKKDFSNIDEVMSKFNDIDKRMELIDNAYKDLIVSKKYSYKKFINEFDNTIKKITGNYKLGLNNEKQIIDLIDKGKRWRIKRLKIEKLLIKSYQYFPFRKVIKMLIKPFFKEKKYY